jgi:hypothetical protein
MKAFRISSFEFRIYITGGILLLFTFASQFFIWAN